MNAVRVIVGGVAALALLVPSVAPSWAAEDDVTVTGVVRLDGVPTAGVEICDLYDHGNCVTSGSGGTFTIVPKLVTVTEYGVTAQKRCLSVTSTDDYNGLGESYKGGMCQLPFSDAEPGSVVVHNIDLKSFPLAWGQVVNRSGRPIVGASVASGYRRESLTDARGRFRVKMGPYTYDEHYLVISAAGYQLVAARFSSDGDLGKIVMPTEGDGSQYSIGGRVVDEKGRPYVGVKVCLVGGECIGTVGEDGYYYGLLASPPASTGYDGVGFALYLPGMSEATLMFRNVRYIQRSFISDVDFTLDGARHLVGPTPRISGSPKVGKRLTVRVRTWLPRPVSTSCAWYVGSKLVKRGCSSLRVKSSYRGKRIRVKVTGRRSGYKSKVVSSRATSRVYR